MIFITGASSAGKTSLIKRLKEQLPSDKFDIHDIDEADKWGDDYESWRDAKIEYWLKQSIRNREKGVETILCGIIYPEHVMKAPSYTEAQPIEFVLLDAAPKVIKERYYKKRQPWLARQMEISQELKSELQHIQNTHIIDTNSITSDDVAEKLVKRLGP